MRRINEIPDEVENLIKGDFPDAAIEPAEYALSLPEDPFGAADDLRQRAARGVAPGGGQALTRQPEVTVRGPASLTRLRATDSSGTAGWGPITASRVVLRPGADAAADVQIGSPANPAGCRAPTWSVTPPGGRRGTILHRAPAPPGHPEPAGPASLCAGGSICRETKMGDLLACSTPPPSTSSSCSRGQLSVCREVAMRCPLGRSR